MIGKQFNINSNVLTSNMKGSNNTIVINGKSYRGNSISISGDGEVIIDGIKQDSVIGKISVTLNGDADSIELESGEVVANNVGNISTQSGDVKCGNVSGSVQTMSGDVRADKIMGSAHTMSGDIISR
ncbi:MAG: hypothetical protein AB7E48_06725 [Deferribacterales bacterium]